MCAPPPPSSLGVHIICAPQTHVPYFYIMIYYVIGGGGGITYWGGTNEKDPISVSIFVNMKCVEIDPFDLKDKEMRLDYEKL